MLSPCSCTHAMLYVNQAIQIPDTELVFSFTRSSGPGGQNVNKVSSRAVLRWNVRESPSLPPAVKQRFLERHAARLTREGHLILQSQKYRDQPRNTQDCLERLRTLLLDVAQAPVKRRPTRRTRGSNERRLQNKKARSERKQNRRRPHSDD